MFDGAARFQPTSTGMPVQAALAVGSRFALSGG